VTARCSRCAAPLVGMTVTVALIACSTRPMSKSVADRADELFAKWNRPDSPGCSLGISRNGTIVYEHGYGMARRSSNEPRVSSPEEVEREIAATVPAGYDLLKFREIVGRDPAPTTVGLSLTAYQRMNDAARRAGLPLVGHAPVNLSLEAMLDARQQSARARRRALLQSGYPPRLAAHFGRNRAPHRAPGRVHFWADDPHKAIPASASPSSAAGGPRLS